MPSTPKPAGASCPKCGSQPAEYQMAGDVMRWRCHGCGAEGVIETAQAEPVKSAPAPHRHWSHKRAI
jgi:hypothetical protein